MTRCAGTVSPWSAASPRSERVAAPINGKVEATAVWCAPLSSPMVVVRARDLRDDAPADWADAEPRIF
jgi:hypothetical protein